MGKRVAHPFLSIYAPCIKGVPAQKAAQCCGVASSSIDWLGVGHAACSQFEFGEFQKKFLTSAGFHEDTIAFPFNFSFLPPTFPFKQGNNFLKGMVGWQMGMLTNCIVSPVEICHGFTLAGTPTLGENVSNFCCPHSLVLTLIYSSQIPPPYIRSLWSSDPSPSQSDWVTHLSDLLGDCPRCAETFLQRDKSQANIKQTSPEIKIQTKPLWPEMRIETLILEFEIDILVQIIGAFEFMELSSH